MTNYGQLAYAEYRRIHAEQGIELPEWEKLKHVQRTAWQAAIYRFADEFQLSKKQDAQTM